MLIKQLRHSGTVYSGRVGARMRPPRTKPPALTVKSRRERVYLDRGPLGGCSALLTSECGISTLTFTLHGKTGRYVGSTWEPARA